MLRIIEQLRATTQKEILVSDDVICVDVTTARLLNDKLAVGDEIYLRLLDKRAYEVVKYTHTQALNITDKGACISVDRAQQGSARKTWGKGTCIHSSYSQETLHALICQAKERC